MTFAVLVDYAKAYFYITDKVPRDSVNIFTLTKKDNTIDYQAVRKSDELMKTLVEIYYRGGLRYSSHALKESFLKVLEFLGVR